MRFSIRVIIILSALTPFLLMKSVWAACYFHTNSLLKQPINTIVQLQGSAITVGPDTANGTTVFRQTYIPTFPNASIQCDSVGLFSYSFLIKNTPLPLSSWNAGAYAGKTYETGVPGLGIAFWSAGVLFPVVRPTTACTESASCTVPAANLSSDISIIKIGPISPGVISGSNLPCASFGVGLPGNNVELNQICFSGILNIVSQTCATPDVNVSMGTFEVSRNFNGIGSSTPWKNASINLVNCPQFYGTLNDGRNTFYSDNDTKGVGAFTPNTLSLSFIPNTSIINNANGIMGLKTGSSSASGVGIQIALGEMGDVSPTFLNFSNIKNYTMVSTTQSTVRIPLLARYIQTESLVLPGRADASATFTINYY
ncbi:fimbrial protein [Yersinia intermedia]|uniref:fimbrial protein n=1 Tax=Yersinia intermedia TaxID=631 RepID=UPI0005E09C87|nr:fimbrial protein [Yersinia intermedia]CNE33365.1 P pilus assembly protein%2C pilin FimA [Yersinia intermedia]